MLLNEIVPPDRALLSKISKELKTTKLQVSDVKKNSHGDGTFFFIEITHKDKTFFVYSPDQVSGGTTSWALINGDDDEIELPSPPTTQDVVKGLINFVSR